MNRIDLKDKNNFIGSWNIDNNDLCKRIIEFFENNKNLQKKGTTVSGVNEKVKKSIDLSIDPKKLNNPEADRIRIIPIEKSVREKIGVVVSPESLSELPQIIKKMSINQEKWTKEIKRLRKEYVYNLGRSAVIGAENILRILRR